MGKWDGHIIDPQNDFRNNQSILHNKKKIPGDYLEKHRPLLHGQIKNAMLKKLMLCQEKKKDTT